MRVGQKVKPQQQQNQNAKIKRAGNRTLDLSQGSLMRLIPIDHCDN